MSLQEKLSAIQRNLSAPKGQKNTFGKYNYRSCEDILEAVKPLLGDLILLLSDEVVLVGDRVYVKATARLGEGSEGVEVTAFAREAQTKKGMDDSQITGAASSYARKYALNGLFCIDDTKDADTNEHRKQNKRHKGETPVTDEDLLNPKSEHYDPEFTGGHIKKSILGFDRPDALYNYFIKAQLTRDRLAAMNPVWADSLKKIYETKKKELEDA